MSDDIHKILQAQAKTHTLLESHVKLSDERHNDLQAELIDHEIRIRKGESFRAKILGWAVGAGLVTASGAEIIKTKIGL